MILLKCDRVSTGLRAIERTAIVHDITNRNEYVRVDEHFLEEREGVTYLPVSVVEYARDGKILIEFPIESDGGTNRIWVDSSNVLQWN